MAGDARAIIGASRHPGHQRAGQPGGRSSCWPDGAHCTAVVSPAADAERAAVARRRYVRLRRKRSKPLAKTGSRYIPVAALSVAFGGGASPDDDVAAGLTIATPTPTTTASGVKRPAPSTTPAIGNPARHRQPRSVIVLTADTASVVLLLGLSGLTPHRPAAGTVRQTPRRSTAGRDSPPPTSSSPRWTKLPWRPRRPSLPHAPRRT